MKSTVKSPGRTDRAGRVRAVLAGLCALTVWGSGIGMAQRAGPPFDIPTGLQRGCRDGTLDRLRPEWVSVEPSDAPQVAEGIVLESHTSSEDVPAFHVSHDWNADVLLDPTYNGLNSKANTVVNSAQSLMEIEWESAFFPPQFWPAPGDRAWMLGRWIFDCGHPPYKTEIHPPKAVAFTRSEPVIFPGDERPSLSSLTHVFIHGRGGYYKTPVVGQNYDFNIPLPPRPTQPNTLKTAILSLPFGGPSPTLALVPNSNPPMLHVTYPLAGVSDPNNTARFGAVIAAAWQTSAPNPNEPTSRLLRVTFDSIKINTDHDPVFSGEWRFWVRAGGQWFEVSGLGDVNSGDTLNINRSVELIVPDDGALEIQTSGWEDDCDDGFRRRDADIKLWSLSLDDAACEANGNDNIGILEQSFKKVDGFGVGSHDNPSSRNGDFDTQGDFDLRYRVELLKVFEPAGNTTGNLQVTVVGGSTPSNPAFPIKVTGPGFSQGLNHTVTLTGLAPGVYTLQASEFFTGQGTRNCRLFSPFIDMAQVTVTAGQTANISVQYSSAPCNA